MLRRGRLPNPPFRETLATRVVFCLAVLVLVFVLIVTDAVGVEVRRLLGPGLRPLGSRVVTGRRTYATYRQALKHHRILHAGGDPLAKGSAAGPGPGPGPVGGELGCDCDDIVGAEQDHL